MSTLRVGSISAPSGTGSIVLPANNSLSGVDAASIYAAGDVVQVQHARTSPTRYAIATDNISAIPELSISFTPKFANSKILLTAMINANSQHVTTFGFLKDGAVIISNTNTNSTGSILTVYDGQDIAGYMYGQYIEFMDTISSTATITYAAAASASWSAVVRTLYINDRDSNDMRSVSSMTAMEIKQ